MLLVQFEKECSPEEKLLQLHMNVKFPQAWTETEGPHRWQCRAGIQSEAHLPAYHFSGGFPPAALHSVPGVLSKQFQATLV